MSSTQQDKLQHWICSIWLQRIMWEESVIAYRECLQNGRISLFVAHRCAFNAWLICWAVGEPWNLVDVDATRLTSTDIADVEARWLPVLLTRLFFKGDSGMDSDLMDDDWVLGEGLRICFFPLVLANWYSVLAYNILCLVLQLTVKSAATVPISDALFSDASSCWSSIAL